MQIPNEFFEYNSIKTNFSDNVLTSKPTKFYIYSNIFFGIIFIILPFLFLDLLRFLMVLPIFSIVFFSLAFYQYVKLISYEIDFKRKKIILRRPNSFSKELRLSEYNFNDVGYLLYSFASMGEMGKDAIISFIINENEFQIFRSKPYGLPLKFKFSQNLEVYHKIIGFFSDSFKIGYKVKILFFDQDFYDIFRNDKRFIGESKVKFKEFMFR